MKNRFLPAAMMVLYFMVQANNACGQFIDHKDSRHELSAGIGDWSYVQLFEGVRAGKEGYSEYPINNFSGIFSLTYRYFITPRLSFGIAMGYENASGDWDAFVGGNNSSTAKMGNFKRQIFTIAPELLFVYSRSRKTPVTAYGYIGAGRSFQNGVNIYSLDYYDTKYINGVNSLGNNLQIQNDKYYDLVQLCPIGFSFGGQLRGFAELGFGYKGIFNLGVSLKL